MIRMQQKGDWSKTISFLNKMKKRDVSAILKACGDKGVAELRKNTPVDTGLTASCWRYEIEKNNGRYTIHFINDNIQNGISIAIILQYGHGTRNGGYVQGIDYINPSLRKAFDEMASDLWEEVVHA